MEYAAKEVILRHVIFNKLPSETKLRFYTGRVYSDTDTQISGLMFCYYGEWGSYGYHISGLRQGV